MIQVDAFYAAEAAVGASRKLAARVQTIRVTLPTGPCGLRVVEHGAAAGEPLVWVHGGGGVGAQFIDLVAAVEARSPNRFRHVLFDRPGCGGSDPFRYTRATDLRAHAVAVLRGVLDALGIERAGFVANSMGGLWSLWFAREAAARVRGLVLVGVPAVFLDTSAPLPMRVAASVPWLGRRVMAIRPGDRAAAAKALAMMGHPTPPADELLDLMSQAGAIPGTRDSFVSLLHAVLGLRGPRISFGDDDWTRVEPPVHLVWGDRDPFGTAASATRARSLRTGTRVDILAGAGHLPWLEARDTCAAAIVEMFL